MKPEIRDRLDRIDAFFPPDRVQASRRRWEAVWNRTEPEERIPFVYLPMLYLPYDDLHTPAQRLDATLDDLLSRGSFRDDTIPSIFPGCKQTTLPNLFGAAEIRVGKDLTCERIIQSPADIDALRWEIRAGTVAFDWLEAIRFLQDATGGRMPIHVVDMQGPFDASAQLCGYDNLILMAYDDPDRYHRLLTLMSDAFVAFWQLQKEILGNLFVGTHLFGWDWIPEGNRATLSMDSLVMFSPDFFEEFVLPHLQSISDRLGSLVVHSCGDFRHMIPVLRRHGFVSGINASQLSIQQMLEASLDPNTVVILAASGDQVPDAFRYVKDRSLHVDMTVFGPYPLNEAGDRWKPSWEWTEGEWETFRRMEDAILESARHDRKSPREIGRAE